MIDPTAPSPKVFNLPLSAAELADASRENAGWAGAPADGTPEPTFRDFLSIINPLQHLPIIGTIYRAITGDAIQPAARVVGGAIFGGPLGFVSAIANALIEQVSGKDIGEHVVAALSPDKSEPVPEIAVAAVEAPAPNAEAKPEILAAIAPAASETPTPILAGFTAGGPKNLAFYQAQAGQRLAPIVEARGGSNGPATRFNPSPGLLPAAAKSPPTAATAAEPPPGAVRQWFATEMMRGLDLYRAANAPVGAPPAVDISR